MHEARAAGRLTRAVHGRCRAVRVMVETIGVKPRKRRKVQAPPAGKETHEIVGPKGEILRSSPYGEGATLLVAQTLAQKYDESRSS
jgi:hypothetical protein